MFLSVIHSPYKDVVVGELHLVVSVSYFKTPYQKLPLCKTTVSVILE